MLEQEVQLLIICLQEYLKNISDHDFKKLFLAYVEYMARNYHQDCLIDEFDLMMQKVKRFVDKYKLDLNNISHYQQDIIYRFIDSNYNDKDVLAIYYFDGKIKSLEELITKIENKYN